MIPALGHCRKDRTDDGWCEGKTEQPQSNFVRETSEPFFQECGFELLPMSKAVKYEAKSPGCFFFRRRI